MMQSFRYIHLRNQSLGGVPSIRKSRWNGSGRHGVGDEGAGMLAVERMGVGRWEGDLPFGV